MKNDEFDGRRRRRRPRRVTFFDAAAAAVADHDLGMRAQCRRRRLRRHCLQNDEIATQWNERRRSVSVTILLSSHLSYIQFSRGHTALPALIPTNLISNDKMAFNLFQVTPQVPKYVRPFYKIIGSRVFS